MAEFSDELELGRKATLLLDLHPPSSWHPNARATLEKLKLEGGRVSVACSGGADSVFALLLASRFFGEKIHCLHVDHGMRGISSTEDAQFVLDLCSELGCPCEVIKLRKLEASSEGALRTARLEAYGRHLKKVGLKYLIQGHQKDDVAESFLWRISRGAGPEGLCSPRPTHHHREFIIFRPFLTFDRQTIRNSLLKLKIPWREDETNASRIFLRNRIRNDLVPLWKSILDRNLLEGVEKSRDLIEEQNDAIKEWVDRIFEEGMRSADGLDEKKLSGEPVAVQRGILNRWLAEERVKFSQARLTEIIQLISSGSNGFVNLEKGIRVRKSSGRLKILMPESKKTENYGVFKLFAEQNLFFPNGRFLGFCQKDNCTEIMDLIGGKKIDPDSEAWICADKFESSFLEVRSRRKGDRFRKLGSGGSKSLKKLMIDAGIPADEREEWPVVSLGEGRILWVPGFPPSHSCKVEAESTKVIRLTYGSTAT